MSHRSLLAGLWPGLRLGSGHRVNAITLTLALAILALKLRYGGRK